MAFLNIQQAAGQFGVSRHTLRAIAKAGGLPGARKVGGRWYVHTDTLVRYFSAPVPVQGAR